LRLLVRPGINPMADADADDVEAITRKVNGVLNGIAAFP
jgi:predicted chitinase